MPGVALVLLGALAAGGLAPGGRALAFFCSFAAVTHLCSALTHVYPDSHTLVRAGGGRRRRQQPGGALPTG